MLKCSVIIPTYNREQLLRHTLASLARQSLARDEYEVIVVDDGSSDGTEQMCAEFAGRLDLRYHFQPDQGFRAGAARNVGILDARSQVCVFIDSGMLVHSDCLREHVAAHAAAEGPVATVGYVYCFVFTESQDHVEEMSKVLDFDDADVTVARLRERDLWPDVRDPIHEAHGEDFGEHRAPWIAWWTCNVSAPTALLRRVGMFDERFNTWGGEDVDLAYRMFRAGASFRRLREAACVHLPHRKAEISKSEGDNLVYIVSKYPTPIVSLLPGFATQEEVHPLNMHEVIVARGLPSCDEYEAQQRAQFNAQFAASAGRRE
jgi:glycosyltransferase involved in cell wall biosynthesis